MTELVDGPSLRHLLIHGKISVSHAVAIIRQILGGLAYAHQQGAVHGDLKPENVLVERSAEKWGYATEGCVKLTDFGVGLVSAAAVLGKTGSSRLMRSDRAIGTLAYIAPEQREGTAPDAKSDLFSCGVMFFELLTGERPAGAESPSDINPAVPPAFDAVFRGAYARRDRRFASAHEFLTALEDAVAKTPGSQLGIAKGKATSTIGQPAPSRPIPPPQSIASPRAAPPKQVPPPPTPSPSRAAIPLEEDSDPILNLRDEEDNPPPRENPLEPMLEKAAPLPLDEPASLGPPPPETEEKFPAFSMRSAPPAGASSPPPAGPPARPKHTGPRAAQQRVVIVIDELARKPLRNADELRALFRQIYLTRDLDAGEIGNLRLRLDSWAESIGGLPDFGQRINLTQAVDCPYHRVVVVTHYEQSDGQVIQNESAVMLGNPAASQDCGGVLELADFTLALHISTASLLPHLLEMIGIPTVRMAAANLINAANAQANGRHIVRQELKLTRSNVLSLKYLSEGPAGKGSTVELGICFAGNSLKVVTNTAPVTRMRDDLLKRAASLLDTENIGAGINELRQMFQTPNPAQPRAEKMLAALRGKLSASYMELARNMAGNLGVFESLTYSTRATQLVPTSDEAAEHARKVRKTAFWIQFGPGLGIGLVFGLIAALTRPFSYGFTAAAAGAMISGMVIWRWLQMRPARTDIAFCHACVVPLALAGILATGLTQLQPIPAIFFCGLLGVSLLIADRIVFRNYGYWLLRPLYYSELAGAPLDVLNQLQTMVEPDWEKLRHYYVALEPLYKHASVKLSDAPLPPSPPKQENAEGLEFEEG